MAIIVNSKSYNVSGSRQEIFASIAMDSSYPYGGEPFDIRDIFGLQSAEIDLVQIEQPLGYQLRYDYTNEKVKVYAVAPVVVFEEVVTLTHGATYTTGTTKYPMAWPLYASNANKALGLLPAGMIPVSTTIAIDMHSHTPGTRATITGLHATDGYTSVTISYITQAWTEVFANLVEAETMTAGATTTNGITFTVATPDVISFLAAGPYLCGLMVGLNLNGTISCPKPCKSGETTVAGEYALDFINAGTGSTTMSVDTGNNWNAATASMKFNYIKKPASGFLYDRFVEEDASAAIAQVWTAAAAVAIKQPLLLSTPGFLPGVTVAATVGTWPLGGTGMVLGTTTQWAPTNWYPRTRAVSAATFTSGTGVSATNATNPSYIYGTPEGIPIVSALEAPEALDLSALTDLKVYIVTK
jgi:hypothetical protein